jgi:hypothetical protein
LPVIDFAAIDFKQISLDQQPGPRVLMSSRPDDHKDGKKHATELLTRTMLKRYMHANPELGKGAAGQDLQELYQVVDGENSSALGDYWLKLARGERSLGDKELSRVAHLAVLHGQITAHDYCALQVQPGGQRLLRMVGGLLVETFASAEVDSDSVARRTDAWEQARVAANNRRTAELKLLRAKFTSAKKKLSAALSAIEALADAQATTEFFEVLYRPEGPVAGTFDEAPYVGPAEQFRTHIESLRSAAAGGLQLLAESQISEQPNHGFADLPAIEAEGTAAEASLKALRQTVIAKLPEDWADDNTGFIRVRRSRVFMKPLPPGVVRELICVENRSTGKPKRARDGIRGKLGKGCHISATRQSQI